MPGRLRALPVGGKLLYSAFAVATLIGLLVSARLYGVAVGGGTHGDGVVWEITP